MSFEFRETMAGSFQLLRELGPADAPSDRASGSRSGSSARLGEDRPMSFTIRARAAATSWLGFLRHPEMEIEGEIDAEGFADHKHLRGSLGLDVLRTRTLPYAFRFTANDGATYSFEGMKTVSTTELAESMTVLPGSIKDEGGAEVGRALLRFDLRSDLLKFLRSFRRAA